MNEVSIIINGVRYDSVKMDGNCSICDMNNENHDCLKIASCPLKAGMSRGPLRGLPSLCPDISPLVISPIRTM